MYWPDTNTGVDVEPARKPVASLVRKYFTEGGAGQAPTVPGGDFFNQITNELLNAVTAAGLDPSKTEDDQLAQAIQLIADSASDSLRQDLAADDGTGLVSFKPSLIAGSIKRSITDVIGDYIIDVKWFGAQGNWDMGTQTGADDTSSIQAAIDFCVLLGTRREGGKRGIRFPPGHYRYSHVTIPATIDFGLSFFTDSPGDVTLWADQSVSGEAFTGLSENTKFVNLNLIGALTDQLGGDLSSCRSLFFKGKLGWNYADIDVHFLNCNISFWQGFVAAHGRGVVFDNCGIGFVQNLLNIVADPNTIFEPSSKFNSLETGMRHYTIRNCRFDVVSVIVDVTGSGPQKEFINGILMVGNDYSQCDILIRATDAIIRRPVVSSSSAVYSFKTGVIQVKALKDACFSSCNLSKGYNDVTGPEVDGDTILSLVRASAWIDGLVVIGVIAANIAGNIVQAGTVSKNVIVSGCHFPNAWSLPTGSNHFVFWSPTYCEGLAIFNNTFSTGNLNGSYYLFDASVQTVTRTHVGGNSAPWPWQDARLRYTPKILINGVETSGATVSFGRYTVSENRVVGMFMVSATLPESSGNISVSLPPVLSVAESVAQTGSYAGIAVIGNLVNISSVGASLLPAKINPASQEIELWKSVNLTASRITAADKTGAVAIYGTFDYRR